MKKSKMLIASMVLGIIYTLYLVFYFAGAIGGSADAAEAIGASIAATLVIPHMACVAIGAIFSIVAVVTSKPWAGLTSMILYFVSGILFLPYVIFSIVLGIVALCGWLNMKKIIDKQNGAKA
ncbi:hypothetical protein [Paraclostridium sordellii]|uniref:hypothetical protein n=1 Tax=Paraclostridium sordellii TaxID=1505 RepID=UPI000C764DF8|nr:hypothetical protein [Paeniclostridium sordellii]AUN14184.1 hypothetical protein RSJ16_08100 [Paeniclostridium sordellii]MDU1455405.1 hypothetical protein [Paeniclostridium sordellii]